MSSNAGQVLEKLQPRATGHKESAIRHAGGVLNM